MLINFLILHLPTEFLTLLISLRLFNIRVNWKKIALISLIQIFFLYYIELDLTSPFLRIILPVTAMIIFISILLNFKLFKSILITFINFSLFLSLKYMLVALGCFFFDNTRSDIFSSTNRINFLAFIFLLLLFIIYWTIKYFNFSLINIDLDIILKNNKNEAIIWVILIITFEKLLLIHYLNHFFILNIDEPGDLLFFSISLLLFVLLSFSVINLFNLINDEVKLATTEEELKNLSKLNFTLKNQQHDFKHHLQLLMTLLQMNKFEQALKYMTNVTEELHESSEVSSTDIPALNGLLQYKVTLAKKYNIAIRTDITTRLEQLSIDDNKICRIMGNLLDNAIEYLKNKSEFKEKYIQIIINAHDDNYYITTVNPVKNESIFREDVEKLLKPGRTSKGKGRGLGLAIIKEIVDKAGGRIKPELDKKEGVLAFHIIIPM